MKMDDVFHDVTPFIASSNELNPNHHRKNRPCRTLVWPMFQIWNKKKGWDLFMRRGQSSTSLNESCHCPILPSSVLPPSLPSSSVQLSLWPSAPWGLLDLSLTVQQIFLKGFQYMQSKLDVLQLESSNLIILLFWRSNSIAMSNKSPRNCAHIPKSL